MHPVMVPRAMLSAVWRFCELVLAMVWDQAGVAEYSYPHELCIQQGKGLLANFCSYKDSESVLVSYCPCVDV